MKKRLLLPLLVVLMLAGCAEKGGQAAAPAETKMAPGTFGALSATDRNGNIQTHDLFAEHTVTMVNIWATWCRPCLAELPDLGQLHKDHADRGFAVVGILGDAYADSDTPNKNIMDLGQQLMDDANADYPMLSPGKAFYVGTMSKLLYYPSTFFVDGKGDIIGEIYEGSRPYEEWNAVIEEIYANLP